MYTEVVLQELHVPRLQHPVHGNVRPAGNCIELCKSGMLLVCQLGSGREVALADLVVGAHIEGRHFVLHIQNLFALVQTPFAHCSEHSCLTILR